jgi:hypothetical protein
MPLKKNFYNYKLFNRDTNEIKFYIDLPQICKEYKTNRQLLSKLIRKENIKKFNYLTIEKVKIPVYHSVPVNIDYTLY